MYKITFENHHNQLVEVHGKIGAIVFIPNEGDLITLRENEFKAIEKTK